MSKKQLPLKITEHIYTNDYIRSLYITGEYFAKDNFSKPIDILIMLAKLGLIHNEVICSKCSPTRSMTLHARKNCIDRFVWACCARPRHEQSVRVNSIFEGSKSNLLILLKNAYLWSIDTLQSTIAHELKVNTTTISAWCKKLQECVQDYLLASPLILGGYDNNGCSLVVEVDESLFFKRKYNIGRYRAARWVFGMIERGTNKCVLVPVENRSAATLLPLIRTYCRPGTTIISDCWAAYRTLVDDTSYTYHSINHSLHFVDPDNADIHTQNIENCWLHAKKKLRAQHGTIIRDLSGYLCEYMFKRRFGKFNSFQEFLIIVKEQIQEASTSRIN